MVNPKKISPETINEIRTRLEKGQTLTEVGKALGLHHTTVHKYSNDTILKRTINRHKRYDENRTIDERY